MTAPATDLLIVGAGLTGLALAYRLRDRGLTITLVEARERTGGRVLTLYGDGRPPREMGATWLGRKHAALWDLLEELELGVFEQRTGGRALYEATAAAPATPVTLPPNGPPSYRIAGGTAALTERLAGRLGRAQLHAGAVVTGIAAAGDHLRVSTTGGDYRATTVVSTLPPALLLATVDIAPTLPAALTEVMAATHTWMGESIKISLTYATPFWRTEEHGGTFFSNVGPVTELYDHADVADGRYALVGFVDGSYHALAPAERRDRVLRQLRRCFGDRIDDHLGYDEVVWRAQPRTYRPYARPVRPHQYNGHPYYRRAYLDGKLFVAGSETAADFPGYLDGAVRSANFVAAQLSARDR